MLTTSKLYSFIFLKQDCIYLSERGGRTTGGAAGSLPSKEPEVGLDPPTLRLGSELRADT